MKVFILIFVLCIDFLSSSALPSTSKVAPILTNLQSDHYKHVLATLEEVVTMERDVIFVDDDLSNNAQSYLTSISAELERDLDLLKNECENKRKCLACFSNDPSISDIAKKTSLSLANYFEDRKRQYEKTFEETKNNIREVALLSDYVYEKYGSDSQTFETNASAFYLKIQKNLRAERNLLENVVDQTRAELIGYYAEITSKTYDSIRNIYNETIKCVDDFISGQ